MGHVDIASRVCKRCGVRKPFEAFHKSRSGYKTKCKDCCSEIASDYWGKNKEKFRARMDAKNDATSLPNKIFIYEYLKTHHCVDCNESNWLLLEFDHVRGEKVNNVSQLMLYDLDVVIEEILKCDVVCSNCHKLRTMTRSNSWRVGFAERFAAMGIGV